MVSVPVLVHEKTFDIKEGPFKTVLHISSVVAKSQKMIVPTHREYLVHSELQWDPVLKSITDIGFNDIDSVNVINLKLDDLNKKRLTCLDADVFLILEGVYGIGVISEYITTHRYNKRFIEKMDTYQNPFPDETCTRYNRLLDYRPALSVKAKPER